MNPGLLALVFALIWPAIAALALLLAAFFKHIYRNNPPEVRPGQPISAMPYIVITPWKTLVKNVLIITPVIWLSSMAIWATVVWRLPPWVPVLVCLVGTAATLGIIIRSALPPEVGPYLQLYATEPSPLSEHIAAWLKKYQRIGLAYRVGREEYGDLHGDFIRLAYYRNDHLMMWLYGLAVVRDIRAVRGELAFSARRACFLGTYGYEDTPYIQQFQWLGPRQIAGIAWYPYEQRLHRWSEEADDAYWLRLTPSQELGYIPRGKSLPLLQPAEADWWQTHMAEKTFRVRVGPRALGQRDPALDGPGRPMRFVALFRLDPMCWVAVTDRDDVLVVRGIERVHDHPDGGLVLLLCPPTESFHPWVAFDAGGAESCSELYLRQNEETIVWFQAGPHGTSRSSFSIWPDDAFVKLEPA